MMRPRLCLACLLVCGSSMAHAQSPAAMKILTDMESGRLQNEIAARPGANATANQAATQPAPSAIPVSPPGQRQLKTLSVTRKSLPAHTQSQCMDLKRLAEGQTGFIDFWQFEVMQIASQTETVLKLPGQNISPVLLTNYSTGNLALGDRVKLVGQVQVTGTRPFAIAGNKIFAIQLQTDDQAESQSAVANTAASGDKLLRTWTDSTGKYKFEARFVELKSGIVKLQGQDGKTKDVALTKLSQLDQTWVRDHMRSRKR